MKTMDSNDLLEQIGMDKQLATSYYNLALSEDDITNNQQGEVFSWLKFAFVFLIISYSLIFVAFNYVF